MNCYGLFVRLAIINTIFLKYSTEGREWGLTKSYHFS